MDWKVEMLNNETFIEVGFRIAGRPHTGWSQYETNVSHLLHSKITQSLSKVSLYRLRPTEFITIDVIVRNTRT